METLTHTLWDSGPGCREQLIPKVSMQYMRKDKDQLIHKSESELVLGILLGLRNTTKIHFILYNCYWNLSVHRLYLATNGEKSSVLATENFLSYHFL